MFLSSSYVGSFRVFRHLLAASVFVDPSYGEGFEVLDNLIRFRKAWENVVDIEVKGVPEKAQIEEDSVPRFLQELQDLEHWEIQPQQSSGRKGKVLQIRVYLQSLIPIQDIPADQSEVSVPRNNFM